MSLLVVDAPFSRGGRLMLPLTWTELYVHECALYVCMCMCLCVFVCLFARVCECVCVCKFRLDGGVV